MNEKHSNIILIYLTKKDKKILNNSNKTFYKNFTDYDFYYYVKTEEFLKLEGKTIKWELMNYIEILKAKEKLNEKLNEYMIFDLNYLKSHDFNDLTQNILIIAFNSEFQFLLYSLTDDYEFTDFISITEDLYSINKIKFKDIIIERFPVKNYSKTIQIFLKTISKVISHTHLNVKDYDSDYILINIGSILKKGNK